MSRLSPYLAAHFAKSQLWHASTLLFVFFLTERCGLAPVATGWIMGVSLLANGVADIALGRCWQDVRSARSAGRRQAIFAPLAAGCFVLACATALLPPPLRLGWALVTILGFRMTYPLIDVPQNTLVPLLAATPAAQRRLLAYRNVASQLANLAVCVLAAPVLIGFDDDRVYFGWAVAVGALACAGAVSLARMPMTDRPPPVDSDAAADGMVPGYRMLALFLAAMVLAGATFRTLEPYYAAFAARGTQFLLWTALGALVAQPLWIAGAARIGAVRSLIATSIAPAAAALLLLTPLRTTMPGAAGIAIGFGIGTGALWLALWSAMVVHARQHDAIGRVSGFTGISKAAQGLAVVMIGHVLDRSDYRRTLIDAASAPSLLMVVALSVIAGCCLALAMLVAAHQTVRAPPPSAC